MISSVTGWRREQRDFGEDTASVRSDSGSVRGGIRGRGKGRGRGRGRGRGTVFSFKSLLWITTTRHFLSALFELCLFLIPCSKALSQSLFWQFFVTT